MMHINLTLPLKECLQKFFNEELEVLLTKYQNIPQDSIDNIEKLLEAFPDHSAVHKLPLDQLLKLSEEDQAVTLLYLWMEEHGEAISLNTAKEFLQVIEDEGYIETSDLILTTEDSRLDDYIKDKLLEWMDDSYHVERFFDKEDLIEMWLEETSKEEAVENLMHHSHSPERELLELEFEEIGTTDDGNTLKIAYKEF